eukprot:TRINITY_DN11029_c0_g1_i2.p1 TRINITY_DN11029_c0_g1~~TRINITY_DN11029_c0_g1_i2.p1  ORF type:complete len:334 (+),score=35.67 TRINITY_DN11029_c0_g1_i2:128-1003(+)
MDLDDNVRKNMFKCSNGLFLIFFNLAAAFASLAPDLRLTAYFGYLVTVSGKALHFLLMGFYIYPLTCKSRSKCDPFRAFDKADGVFDKLLVVGSFTSIILGIMLLVLRCTGLSSHRSIGLQGGGGVSVALDGFGLAAVVASIGMIVYGIVHLDKCMNAKLGKAMFECAVAGFTLTGGIASLLSSVQMSPTVAMLFGFLYHPLGRGLFYMLIGFYMCSQTSYENDHKTHQTVSFVCSIASMVVGSVYLVMYCFGNSYMRTGGVVTYATQPAPAVQMRTQVVHSYQTRVVSYR